MSKFSCFVPLTICVALHASAQEPTEPQVINFNQEADEVESDRAPSALTYTVKSIDGAEVDLSDYKGNVVVIVNTASKCGMTSQYKQLQELHEGYGDKGVKVLGFPCNQFGRQEPGSETDIKEFCTLNYGVTFDMFSKIDVNGENASELYKFLTSQELEPKGSGNVGWNFEKFVLDKSGKPIARFGSKVKPNSKEFMNVIKAALKP